MRLIYKSRVRVRQCRFLVTYLGFLPTKPIKIYEDNAAVVTSFKSNKITPKIRNVDLPLAYFHYECTKEVFEAVQTPSRIQINNMGTETKSAPSLVRSASIEMGHAHIQCLSNEHHAELIKPAPLGCYKYYSRIRSTDKKDKSSRFCS